VKRGAVSALLAALTLTGCATTPAPHKPLTATDQVVDVRALRAVPLRAKALASIEQGTRESLQAAAQLLATPDAAGIPDCGPLIVLGNALFIQLYPSLDSPFPADTAPFGPQSTTAPSDFLAKVIPGLALLHGDSPIDDPASLATALGAADALNDTSVLPPYLEGILSERNGDLAAARAQYNEALRRGSTFYPAARALVALSIETGAAPGELSRLLYLASLLPAEPDRLEATARASLAGGKPELAADAAAQGLLATPDDPTFALLRARALEAQGDWYQAVRILDVLTKLQPDMAEALLARARLAYERQEDQKQALALLADAQKRFPKDAGFPELAGRILMETGAEADAESALEQAIALAPGRPSTLALLEHLAVTREQWSDALRWFDTLPDSAKGPQELGDAWQAATATADHARALTLARALEAAAPGAAAMILEARSLVSQGQGSTAIPVVDAALADANSASQRAELYYIRSIAGSTDPVRDLRSAVREDPDSLPALLALVEALTASQDYRKALEYARHAAALSPRDADLARRVSELEQMTASGK